MKNEKKAPYKSTSYKAVREALKNGQLVKGPCESCGSTAADVQAHHDDHSKPLDVRWLCPTCHYALHKELKRMAKGKPQRVLSPQETWACLSELWTKAFSPPYFEDGS
jgi:hypothetical protein